MSSMIKRTADEPARYGYFVVICLPAKDHPDNKFGDDCHLIYKYLDLGRPEHRQMVLTGRRVVDLHP